MEKNKDSFFQVIIFIYFYIFAFQFINPSLYFTSYNYAKYILIPTFLLGIIMMYNAKTEKLLIKDIITVIILFIAQIVSIAYTKDSVGYVINIIFFPIAVTFFCSFNWSRKLTKSIFYLFMILGIWGYYLSINIAEKYYIDRVNNFNPNTIGSVLLFCIIYINILGKKVKFNKGIIFILNIIFTFGILNSDSRASLMAVIIFFVMMYFIPRKIYNTKNILVAIFLIILIIGTIFPFIYTNMYEKNIDFTIPFSNKDLYTGREYLWSSTLSIFEGDAKAWLFGKGSKIYTTLNAHNTYLHIITIFGLIVYFIYFYFIYTKVKQVDRRKIKSYDSVLYIIGWFTIMIHGYVEVYWSAWTIVMWSGALLGMAANEMKQEDENEEIIKEITNE